ncbi:MAG: PSD1 and planctomycete cytochrome C domain-containing protein [Planctomycetaceae bacterium]
MGTLAIHDPTVTPPRAGRRTTPPGGGALPAVARLVWAVVITTASPARVCADEGFFTTRVAPLLQRRCLPCHSHGAGRMEGSLALDWRSGWERGGDRGPAIVPGDPDASLLITAVRHTDAILRMPSDPLPADEIATLTEWVRRGADDPRSVEPQIGDWWSLQPLRRPVIPGDVPDGNAVDAFIDARLVGSGIGSASAADRRTLVRRLTLDLHGIQPSPDEVEAFVVDDGDGAVTRLVDRLLESPRYGERFARHWFDSIHFADSHGFEHDVFRPAAWPFRDWVIAALNADMPWPTFVRAQLAADHFFPDDGPERAALGFLGAGPYDHSAASTAPRTFEYLDRDDLVTQTMGSLASTTANCARCHDHKFDPITQEDYYALQAVFAGVGKGEIDWEADAAVAAARRRWQRLADRAATAPVTLLDMPEGTLVSDWEAAGPRSTWRTLPLTSYVSAFGAELVRQDDGSIVSRGVAPDRDVVTLSVAGPLPPITALRIDVMTDPSLPMTGPGRAPNGNFHLSDLELTLFPADAGEPRRPVIARASADFEQEGWAIAQAIDGQPATAWGIHPREGQSHHAVFVPVEAVVLGAGDTLVVSLRQLHGGAHVIGRFRCSWTDGDPALAVALSADAEAALAVTPAARSRDQSAALAGAVVGARARAELAALPAPRRLYAAAATATNERGTISIRPPRVIHLLESGDIDRPGQPVGPGSLSAIAALPARFELPPEAPESARRAALADWLVHPANPLTWRSIANRVWHWHFGRGLCDTPGDIGRMGGLPSHPELLDWLACELRDSGSLKHLHRLIVTSRAYGRVSTPPPGGFARDPDGRSLAWMPRRRMDAESFFDSVLAVAGRLDETRGGPGIARFTQRPGAQLTPILDYGAFDLDAPGADRRAIYRVVWRGIPDPLFDALDFPDLGLLTPSRGFSASALQSLVLANNRFVLHQARAFGLAAERLPGQTIDRVRWMVRRAWLRDPSAEEAGEFVALAERHGCAALARALFNADDFLFID